MDSRSTYVRVPRRWTEAIYASARFQDTQGYEFVDDEREIMMFDPKRRHLYLILCYDHSSRSHRANSQSRTAGTDETLVHFPRYKYFF